MRASWTPSLAATQYSVSSMYKTGTAILTDSQCTSLLTLQLPTLARYYSAVAENNDIPVHLVRNIGIIAHIDAGK
jgi:hypothetical protein